MTKLIGFIGATIGSYAVWALFMPFGMFAGIMGSIIGGGIGLYYGRKYAKRYE